MSNDNDIRRGRHCVFLMHVHLVFVTKYRREVFTKEILDDLRNIFSSPPAGELPAQGGRLQPREQPEGRVQPHDPQKELPEHPQEAVGRCPVVAVLLCWQLRRCTHRDHPPVHRTAADATLTAQRTPTASALSFPGLEAEACRAPRSIRCRLGTRCGSDLRPADLHIARLAVTKGQ